MSIYFSIDSPFGQKTKMITKKTTAGVIGTAMAQQHLRNVLAFLDVPTLAQPEAFIHAKDGLFDESGNIGKESIKFLQNWMNRYVEWVKKHVA